jgi:MtN3 and saliva related transmembrane protein
MDVTSIRTYQTGGGRNSSAIMKEPLMTWLSDQSEMIGYCAGTLTTIAFLPQVIRTWRAGGEAISGLMLALFGTGVSLWFVYGLLRNSRSIMLANGVTDLLVVVILVLKLRRARRV